MTIRSDNRINLIINLANQTVDALHVLAREADPEYSEECADTGLTNYPPETDEERFVWLLHKTALVLNASGLCDPPAEFERYIPYGT